MKHSFEILFNDSFNVPPGSSLKIQFNGFYRPRRANIEYTSKRCPPTILPGDSRPIFLPPPPKLRGGERRE